MSAAEPDAGLLPFLLLMWRLGHELQHPGAAASVSRYIALLRAWRCIRFAARITLSRLHGSASLCIIPSPPTPVRKTEACGLLAATVPDTAPPSPCAPVVMESRAIDTGGATAAWERRVSGAASRLLGAAMLREQLQSRIATGLASRRARIASTAHVALGYQAPAHPLLSPRTAAQRCSVFGGADSGDDGSDSSEAEVVVAASGASMGAVAGYGVDSERLIGHSLGVERDPSDQHTGAFVGSSPVTLGMSIVLPFPLGRPSASRPNALADCTSAPAASEEVPCAAAFSCNNVSVRRRRRKTGRPGVVAFADEVLGDDGAAPSSPLMPVAMGRAAASSIHLSVFPPPAVGDSGVSSVITTTSTHSAIDGSADHVSTPTTTSASAAATTTDAAADVVACTPKGQRMAALRAALEATLSPRLQARAASAVAATAVAAPPAVATSSLRLAAPVAGVAVIPKTAILQVAPQQSRGGGRPVLADAASGAGNRDSPLTAATTASNAVVCGSSGNGTGGTPAVTAPGFPSIAAPAGMSMAPPQQPPGLGSLLGDIRRLRRD